MAEHRPRADRYSRLVGVLKLALPAIALLLLALLFLTGREDTLEGGLFFADRDMSAMRDGLRLTNPQLSGATRAGDRYSFTAVQVRPDGIGLTRFVAEALSGTIERAGGVTISLAAPGAIFDQTGQTLSMQGGVEFRTSDGYRGGADRIEATLADGILVAREVRLEGPVGRMMAGELRLEPPGVGGDRVMRFRRGVRLRYVPGVAGGGGSE